MTSPEDATLVKPKPSFAPGVPLSFAKTRYSTDSTGNVRQQSPPPFSGAPLTESSIGTRSSLRHADNFPSRTSSPGRRLSSQSPALSRSLAFSPLGNHADVNDDIRSLIIRAFSPVIGIYASPDTDELVRQKGMRNGFRELVRPFGERISGKIVIRDSTGSSRTWEDYGVRFVDLNSRPNTPDHGTPQALPPLDQLEQLLEKYVHLDDELVSGPEGAAISNAPGASPFSSPLYRLCLRRLFSAGHPVPHETFGHPVTCVIVISSRTPSPLESVRQLYDQSSHGGKKPPPWVFPEYLRYYVLVHDEDHDDIAKSTALFDQMKRHCGLNCHLLRLRSIRCVPTDDDSTRFPPTEWISPAEDLSNMDEQEPLINLGPQELYLFESDVTAIKAFVRELVAQSVIPHMESRISLWNDQVASRRRGISGTILSISKRWTGFGSSSRSSHSNRSSGSGTSYDSRQGYYVAESQEGLLRKMADYAFMLRDWKLAASTYELIISDYYHDKAWKYHAAANEMCAVSALLNPLTSSKARLDYIDRYLDTASYSYFTRCSDIPNTLRCIILGIELLKSRGGAASEAAARWAMRALDMNLLGAVGRILLHERISACYASKTATLGTVWGTRHRKAGMWVILAADAWLSQGKPDLASICLEEAHRQYGEHLEDGSFAFPEMQTFATQLKQSIQSSYLQTKGFNTNNESEMPDTTSFSSPMEETSEKLDVRSHRKSVMNGINTFEAPHGLSIRRMASEDETRYDDFE